MIDPKTKEEIMVLLGRPAEGFWGEEEEMWAAIAANPENPDEARGRAIKELRRRLEGLPPIPSNPD